MKTETKTSKLAIICALCTLVATPAISAAPVRVLGGAGTYNSASSASASKSATSASTRAGALRVLPTSSKTTNNAASGATTTTGAAGGTVTATRAATSPRLSIGKYLPHRVVAAGSSSTNKPSDDGNMDFVTTDKFGNLQDRIVDLEKFIGAIGDSGLRQDIDALVGRVDTMVDGEDFAAVQEMVSSIETDIKKIDELIAELPDDVADKTVVDAAISSLDSRVSSIAEKLGNGEIADAETVEDLQLLVGAINSAVSTLESSVATLRTDVDNNALLLAGKQDKIIEGEYASVNAANQIILDMAKIKQEIADVTVGEVEISFDEATNELKWLVDGGVGGVVRFNDIYYTESEIDALDDRITKSVGAIKIMADENRELITELQKTVADYKAKHDTLSGYVADNVVAIEQNAKDIDANADAIAALETNKADKSELENYVPTNQVTSYVSNSITSELIAAKIADKSITAEKLTTDGLAEPLLDGELAMLVSDGNGGLTWVAYAVE